MKCAELLAFARAQGVAMGSIAHGTHIGWTRNEDAALAIKDEGGQICAVPQSDGFGWEVKISPDPVVTEETTDEELEEAA